MLILPNYRASWSSFYLIITPVHEQKVINPSTSIPASDCLVDIFLKKRYFSLFLGKKKKKKDLVTNAGFWQKSFVAGKSISSCTILTLSFHAYSSLPYIFSNDKNPMSVAESILVLL